MKYLGKLLMLGCAAVFSMAACKDGKTNEPYTPADRLESDSLVVMEQAKTDSLAEVEAKMPVAADELFDDFFFNYATSKRLQLERTVFPLPVRKADGQEQIGRKQWKMEHFFMQQDYYTLLFDSPEEVELVTDTTVSHVVVEHVMLADATVCQYLFNRQKGIWRLTEIVYQPLSHNPNAQFFSFYQRFVADSLFQQASLAKQIDFLGPDSEDDFQTIEGVITPDFWSAFAPEFPTGDLYNIVYGHQNPAAIQKIFLIRGIANGLEVEVTFELQKGRWKLTKLMN